MGGCVHSKQSHHVTPATRVERPLNPAAIRLRNSLIEIKRAREAPTLSIVNSPLYKRRFVKDETCSSGSLYYEGSFAQAMASDREAPKS